MSNSGSFAIQKSIVSTKGAQSTANEKKKSISAIISAALDNDYTPTAFIRNPITQITQNLKYSLPSTPTSNIQNTSIQSSFSSNQSASSNSSSTIYSSTTPNSTNADNPYSVADSTAEQPSDNSLSINSDDNQTNQPNGADIQLPASATIPNPGEITSKTDSLVPNPSKVPLTENQFEVIRLTNAARQEKGLPPLIVSAKLIDTAKNSSDGMQAIGRMKHGLTSGWSRENIAMGQRSPEEVVRAWLNSPGHYANIMSNSKYIGVGDTSNNSGRIFWTMQTAF